MITRSRLSTVRCPASSMGPLIAIMLGLAGGASAQFVDATSGPLGDIGDNSGVAWGDYDNDGDLDLYIANESSTNKLFRNDGGGTFVDVTSSPLGDAGDGRGVAWGDYDNDGDLDLYLANENQGNKLFRNDGGGTFVDVTSAPLDDTGNSRGVAWGDYDNDGDLDLYLANYGQANKLFRNDGGGTFVDATSGPLGDAGVSSGVAWGDYDNDGDLDLYLANNHQANKLLRNDGGGTFVDATSGPLGDTDSGWGVAWGDYDNDGDLDLYLAKTLQANKLFRNDGGGTFADATSGPLGDTGTSFGVAWGDYDNDGDLDLYIVNSGEANKLLSNDGGGTFVDATSSPLDNADGGRSVAWGDYDNDGDLDIYLTNFGQANKLFRNEAAAGQHWLQVKLRGTTSNRSGIGARVKVVTGGVSRIREISGGSGYLSQDAMVASFGLGTAAEIDLVEVRWPGGNTEQYIDVTVDQKITLVEGVVFSDVADILLGDTGSGRGVAWGDYDGDGALDLYLSNSGSANKLFHNEGGGIFTDGTHGSLGDTGPGRAAVWGDYDNDNDLDLYMVKWDAGNKLLRNDEGTFVDTPTDPHADPGLGTAAAWGDFDNDGFLDLYHSIGGNYNNRLFHNNRDGTFTDVEDSPPLWANSHGVAWSDFNNDGNLDLYVANYGYPNRLMRNDGDGFTNVSTPLLANGGYGLGVAWGDYDNDGDLDLYLTNEGPNVLFRNEGDGAFSDATSGPLGDTGTGRGVGWADYDNDGDLDLYLVNTGTSNKLFRNNGDGSFTDVTSGSLADAGNGYGMAWGDYDADGDLDIYVSNAGQANLLLRNNCSTGNHWLHIDLVGVAINAAAIGQRVRVVAGGLDQVREISGGSSYLSQNSLTAEFGLGSAITVDLVEIIWPSGVTQRLTDLAVDQAITITEETPYAAITSVVDVPEDQGGWVRVHFSRSGYDRVGEETHPIANYDIYRRIDDPLLATAILERGEATPASRTEARVVDDPSQEFVAPSLARDGVLEFEGRYYLVADTAEAAAPPGIWEVVGNVSARQEDQYICLAPTLADSPPSTTSSVYFIAAHTTTPSVFYDSPPDSGWSVDNIAPGVPTMVTAAYQADGVTLAWEDAPETDFQYYRIYRGDDPGFALSPENIIHETANSAWTDPSASPWDYDYQITTLDHAGNESEPASPGTVSGVRGGAVPARTALLDAVPNPFNPSTNLFFETAAAGHVRLDVYDVAGRLVATLVDEARDIGRHHVTWDGRDTAGRTAAAGVYLYRLKVGSYSETKRMVLVK